MPRGWRACPRRPFSYRAALAHGLDTGHRSAARQADAVAGQLEAWVADGWFAGFVADAPDQLRGAADRAAGAATGAVAELAAWLRSTYLPAVADVPDAVGRDRYQLSARQFLGATVDPEDAYAFGWAELDRISAEMAVEAERVLPGADVATAFAHLDREGPAVEGVEEVRAWLQAMMDRAIADLDGSVVDIAEPVRRVEARIAPAGAAAAPVLHATVAGLLPPGAHLAADPGPDPLPAARPGEHLVPRGGPRSPPPAGHLGGRAPPSCRGSR